MEKLEILKIFLEDGIQLTPKALDMIFENQDIIDKIRNFAKKRNLILIDENIFLELKKEETQEIKILYPEEIVSYSIEDVIKMYKERFEFLSNIIQKNYTSFNLTSLSKIKKLKNGDEAMIIGMVKDKTTYTILLEDFTGYETIKLDAKVTEKLFFDDVLGIRVRKEGEEFIGYKVFFPSLTFFRKVSNLEKEVIISISGIRINSKILPIKPADVVRIYINDYKLFLLDLRLIESYKQRFESYIDVLASLIERRHLNPSFLRSKKLYKKDLFLLDEIPDSIIILNSNEAIYRVYKGINIFFLPKNKSLFLKERNFSE
jgi:DNA polymerase II small subunit/DNA polymerase delta subunit B